MQHPVLELTHHAFMCCGHPVCSCTMSTNEWPGFWGAPPRWSPRIQARISLAAGSEAADSAELRLSPLTKQGCFTQGRSLLPGGSLHQWRDRVRATTYGPPDSIWGISLEPSTSRASHGIGWGRFGNGISAHLFLLLEPHSLMRFIIKNMTR